MARTKQTSRKSNPGMSRKQPAKKAAHMSAAVVKPLSVATTDERHEKSLQAQEFDIIKISNTPFKWVVPSFTKIGKLYIVVQQNDILNCCKHRCSDCNICVHAYKCSCPDLNQICKHIHRVACSSINQLSVDNVSS